MTAQIVRTQHEKTREFFTKDAISPMYSGIYGCTKGPEHCTKRSERRTERFEPAQSDLRTAQTNL